jgi:hypothetical protein
MHKKTFLVFKEFALILGKKASGTEAGSALFGSQV